MKIIPAIDILGGKVVRLYQGNYQNSKVYNLSPIIAAKQFKMFEWLHIVDLDGAKVGKPVNFKIIKRICQTSNAKIQAGGGIRTKNDIQKYLNLGVDKVILGTKALESEQFLKEVISEFGSQKITVSLDILNSKVAINGWTEQSKIDYKSFLETLKATGINNIIVTDISKDGTMTEPNYKLIKTALKIGFNVTASGGVSSLKAIKKLESLNCQNAIVGKALYENILTPEDLIPKSNLTKRIIPCLDIKNNQVVKGTNFKNLQTLGDPIMLAKYYSQNLADELVILDITATNQNRPTFINLIKKISAEIFIPLTVGGGIKSITQIRQILNSGADKVAINSAAIKNPNLIKKASQVFGSQAIVCAIDYKKVGNTYRVFSNAGQLETKLELLEWSKQVEALGAGEILLTSIDTDGTKSGFDITPLKLLNKNLNIPVIASGGAGKKPDFYKALEICDAVLAAGVFHSSKIKIKDLKKYLSNKNLNIRI